MDQFFHSTVAPAYIGPGDVVSGALGWWGLRGYTSAYSTGSNPSIDVVDTATGLTQTTINILSDGSLDVATISGLGYGVSVKQLYDQSGNNLHMSQATLSKMPILTLNAIGSLPGMTFDGTTQGLKSATNLTTTQPLSISAVFKPVTTPPTVNGIIVCSVPVEIAFFIDVNTGNLFLYSGSFLDGGAITNGNLYSGKALVNGASSTVRKNGSTAGPGAAGANAPSSAAVAMGFHTTNVEFLNAVITEAGYWPGDKSGSFASLETNERTYWGF